MTDRTASHGGPSLVGSCSPSGAHCCGNRNAGLHTGAASSLPGDTELGAPSGRVS